MAKLLNQNEISAALKNLNGWAQNAKHLEKVYETKDFRAAIRLVNAIADEAESMDHHPDILLYEWNKVRITLSTHSEGGITNNDTELAAKIDALPDAMTAG